MTYLALILLAACIVLGFCLYVTLAGTSEQIRDLLEEREELLTEIRRLALAAVRDADIAALRESIEAHPAGRALRPTCHRCGLDGPAHSLGGVAEDCIYMPYPEAPVLAHVEASDEYDDEGDWTAADLAEALTERDAEHEGGAGA